jgi:hypothetical protein
MDSDGDFVVAWESYFQKPSFNGVYAQRFGVQQPPAVATLTDSPGNVIVGNNVTLTASNITSDSDVASVSFYRETNGVAGLQVGFQGDTLVGTDTTPNIFGDYAITFSTAGLTPGTYTYWAQATDVAGLPGAPASTTNTVIPPAPTVTGSTFAFDTDPHKLTFTFSQDVSASLGTNDLVVQNLTTSQTIPATQFSLTYDTSTNAATFTYTGPGTAFAGVLPNGRYRATLVASGITNSGGTPLPANHLFNFLFLSGDANNDGTVGLPDFNLLAGNFGLSNRVFSQGDFNYDTLVDLSDFNILAAQFGISVAPPRRFSETPLRADPRDNESPVESMRELLS